MRSISVISWVGKIYWRRDRLPTPVLFSFPCGSVGKESASNAGDPRSIFWVRKIHWRRDRLPTPVFLGFPCGSARKESTYNVGDLGLIPGLGRSSGEEKSYPVFWPGEFHGLYSPWGCKESDTTERLSLSHGIQRWNFASE